MEPGGSATGMRAIPYYSSLQLGNLKAMKQLAEECLGEDSNAADSGKIHQPTLADWLRFTEVTGLAELIHFFRYVECAVTGDRRHNDKVVPDDPQLNPDEIKKLVLEIGTKVPGFSPFQRFLVLPHIWSHICSLLTTICLLCISWVLQNTPTCPEAKAAIPFDYVPKVLANNSFHGPTSPLQTDQTLICNLMDGVDRAGTDHPIEITRGVLKSGRIWRMDFTEVAMRYEPPGSRGPPLQMLDPNYNFLDTLSPEQKCYYLHHTRHWVREIIDNEVVLLPRGMGLHVSRMGFVTPTHYDTLSIEALRLPPPEAMVAQESREQRVKEEQRIDGPLFDSEEIDGPSPLADTVLETLERAPPMRCVSWNSVQTTLSSTTPEEKTTKKLLELVRFAVEEEKRLWSVLDEFKNYIVGEISIA
ncbi:hypothetical protein ACHAPE_008492 [Trichoderma viride]